MVDSQKRVGLLYVVILIALSSCSLEAQSRPIAISYLIDKSASAENDEHFQMASKRVCQALAKGIAPGDEFGVLSVTGEPALFENLVPANPALIRRECQQPVKSTTKPGTLTCQAFAAADKQLQASNKIPLLIAQIAVNEREKPCPRIWRATAQRVIERGGSVLILNSSNEAGESFRPELEAAFDGLRIRYAHTNPEIAIKKAIEEARKEIQHATK